MEALVVVVVVVVVVVGQLAAGAGAMVVGAGGQIGALSLEEVGTVTIARRIKAGTSRLGENARGQWNQMGGTTRECGAKLCPPSWFHHHQRNQGRTTESRD